MPGHGHAHRHRHHHWLNLTYASTSPPSPPPSPPSSLLHWLHEQLPPGHHTFELVLLAVAFKACLVMWVVARRARRDEDYAAVGSSESSMAAANEANYRRLRNLYLSVYALATFGDWIQGGFLYALYSEYGFSMREVSLIFVAGYASAATVGTYVAALGDLGGHRRNCVAYGVLYAASCLLCNSASVWVLIAGRVLGGVAYSILYTSFESWLIAEADHRRVPMHDLARLFSVATFSNAGTAVIAGMIGHVVVEVFPHDTHNKFAAAFDVGAVVLLGAGALAALLWNERFGGGGAAAATTAFESLRQSCRAIRRSRELLYLGLVNSLYEAALYVFVFLWTPALEKRAALSPSTDGSMGHGLVFSIFMLSKMAGSQAFHALSQRLSPATCLQLVFAGSAACLAAPLLTSSYERTLLAFCGFEALLGIYWPAIALIRCGALDDAQRASTMAVFRILLNVLVISILPLAGGLPEGIAFALAAALLLICLACIGVVKAEEEEAARTGGGRRRPGDVLAMSAVGLSPKGSPRERPVYTSFAEGLSECTGLQAAQSGADGVELTSGELSGGESDEAKRDRSCESDALDPESHAHCSHPESLTTSPSVSDAVGMQGLALRAWEYVNGGPRRGKYSPVTVSAEWNAHSTCEMREKRGL